MKSYPVSIARQSYRGSDARKRMKVDNLNRIAGRIEEHLNHDLASKPDDTIHVYISHSVAREIGEDEEAVRRIIFATDGGGNGITIVKGDFKRAIMAEREPAITVATDQQ
jgi:hypothetical protein